MSKALLQDPLYLASAQAQRRLALSVKRLQQEERIVRGHKEDLQKSQNLLQDSIIAVDSYPGRHPPPSGGSLEETYIINL